MRETKLCVVSEEKETDERRKSRQTHHCGVQEEPAGWMNQETADGVEAPLRKRLENDKKAFLQNLWN